MNMQMIGHVLQEIEALFKETKILEQKVDRILEVATELADKTEKLSQQIEKE